MHIHLALKLFRSTLHKGFKLIWIVTTKFNWVKLHFLKLILTQINIV